MTEIEKSLSDLKQYIEATTYSNDGNHERLLQDIDIIRKDLEVLKIIKNKCLLEHDHIASIKTEDFNKVLEWDTRKE